MNQVITGDSLVRGGGKHLDQIPASRLARRLELLLVGLRLIPVIDPNLSGWIDLDRLGIRQLERRVVARRTAAKWGG